jgi:hypothetical protein
MADPQKPLKTTALSLNGQAVTFDDIPKASVPLPSPGRVTIQSQYEKYMPDADVDYTDLSAVNREIQLLRMRLHAIRNELREAERQALRTKYAYESKKKRILIGLSGGSAVEREAMAELMAEEEYTQMLVAAAVAKEIINHNRDIRTELEALREISNNLRRQIDLQ